MTCVNPRTKHSRSIAALVISALIGTPTTSVVVVNAAGSTVATLWSSPGGHPGTPVRVQRLIRGWPCPDAVTSPNQLRWNPLPAPGEPTDFVQGLFTIGGNGSPATQSGCSIHWYVANRTMRERFFYDPAKPAT